MWKIEENCALHVATAAVGAAAAASLLPKVLQLHQLLLLLLKKSLVYETNINFSFLLLFLLSTFHLDEKYFLDLFSIFFFILSRKNCKKKENEK